MAVGNNGLLDGIRQIPARFRALDILGGLPGAPLGFRLRGATASGHPVKGTWRTGDMVPDRTGAWWTCTAGGTPGTWAEGGGSAALPFTVVSPSGDASGATDAAAINAVISAGGNAVLAQTGTGTPYYVSAPLTPATGSSLRGTMPWSASAYDTYGAGVGAVGGTVIKGVAGFSGTAVINMTNATGTQYYGAVLENFTVDCSAITSATVEAMHVEGAWGACFMSGVMLFNSGGCLLHFATNGTTNFAPDDWHVFRCKFSASYGTGASPSGVGVYADNLPDSWFTDCESSENQSDNWLLNYSLNTHLVDCKGENSAAGAGFHLGGQGGAGRALNLTGCTTHLNYGDGFLFDVDGADGATGGIYQLANCTSISDNQAAGTTYAGYRSNGCPNVIMAVGCNAYGAYYGASQAGTNGGMNFFASSLSGTSAPVHDDGTGTNRLMYLAPAGGNALTVSSDGSHTAPGAMWFTPAAGHSAALNMLNETSGTTFALMPEVANAGAGVAALGGYGSAWVVAGPTSGTGDSILQVSDSNGDQDLRVQDNGVVETLHNTLDDGSGNATVAGTVTVGSGIADAEQFMALTTTYTLATGTALQKLFNATTNGALTVAASTSYFFECAFDLSAMATTTTSGNFSFGFGGTATLTSVRYTAHAQKSAAVGTPATAQVVVGTAAAATALVPGSTTATGSAFITGVVRVNAAGTLIPEVALNVSTTTAVVATNARFRIWPVGSNTVTNVGDWS